MNSACIIAACAANARARQQKDNYKQYITNKDFEVYYKVNFRMYLHFNSITIVSPTEKAYLGSIFAPYEVTCVKPVKVPATTIAKARTFSVQAKKCVNGPDQYVKDNLSRFENSEIWESEKFKIESEYLNDIEKRYNIILDRSSLDYTVQFCWDIS